MVHALGEVFGGGGGSGYNPSSPVLFDYYYLNQNGISAAGGDIGGDITYGGGGGNNGIQSSGDEISLGDGLPKIKVWTKETPGNPWNRFTMEIRVYGEQFSDYNFIQTQTNIFAIPYKIDDWEPDPLGFYNYGEWGEYFKQDHFLQGAQAYFRDTPNSIIFNAELTICGLKGKIWMPIGTVNWGYNFTNKGSSYYYLINSLNPVHLLNVTRTLYQKNSKNTIWISPKIIQ